MSKLSFIGCASKHILFCFNLFCFSSRQLQTMGNYLEISIAGRKCLCVSGKVVLWSKQFEIRVLVPMCYLKLCSHMYINIYGRMVTNNNSNNYNDRAPGATGGSKESGSSNQRRHTQGWEKRRPSTLMLRETKRENAAGSLFLTLTTVQSENACFSNFATGEWKTALV